MGAALRLEQYEEAPRRRYWDARFRRMAAWVLPGDVYVSDDPSEMIVTILGSCVAACIRDPETGLGGVNHFLLPGDPRGSWAEPSHAMRYGQHAMELLINALLARGCRRDRLEIKLFGGANVSNSRIRVGSDNVEFVRGFMAAEELDIAAEDLGGTSARRICYLPASGQVLRLLLTNGDDDRSVFSSELSYRDRLSRQRHEGSVELFD